MLAVFVNNKLISCDTILPLVLEVAQRCGPRAKIRFFTTDVATHDAIRGNVVLRDAIESVGRIDLIGRRKNPRQNFVLHRFRIGLLLLPLIARALAGRAVFMHFRQLSEPPLRALSWFNPQGTYFCESDSWGETELMLRVSEVDGPRRQRQTGGPRHGALLAFQPHWSWLHDPSSARLHRYVFGPTRVRRAWLDFVRKRADSYFAEAFVESGIPECAEIGAFMLGYFGSLNFMRSPDSVLSLFRETLDVYAEVAPDLPLFLKPHVFTDMDVVRREVARRPQLRVVITNLHPTVLAMRAKLFVANYYSTTLADAFSLNVPTVEYSEYSDSVLAISERGSMRPEYVSHFVQRDPSALRRILVDCLHRPKTCLPAGLVGDPSGVIDAIAARVGAAA